MASRAKNIGRRVRSRREEPTDNHAPAFRLENVSGLVYRLVNTGPVPANEVVIEPGEATGLRLGRHLPTAEKPIDLGPNEEHRLILAIAPSNGSVRPSLRIHCAELGEAYSVRVPPPA
ncbi:hypothetical protein BJF85_20850 [Saccharomonospora sp. CUA-673]|nr:hypothetical protein BJF85_20850 [Saccharomonospora sp. CUA-673]